MHVAQASKPAVSPTSKSAGRRLRRCVSGFGNPRYSRLGSLRYAAKLMQVVKYPGLNAVFVRCRAGDRAAFNFRRAHDKILKHNVWSTKIFSLLEIRRSDFINL